MLSNDVGDRVIASPKSFINILKAPKTSQL